MGILCMYLASFVKIYGVFVDIARILEADKTIHDMVHVEQVQQMERLCFFNAILQKPRSDRKFIHVQ